MDEVEQVSGVFRLPRSAADRLTGEEVQGHEIDVYDRVGERSNPEDHHLRVYIDGIDRTNEVGDVTGLDEYELLRLAKDFVLWNLRPNGLD